MSGIINPSVLFNADRAGVAIGPIRVTADQALGGYTVIGKYLPKVIRAVGTKIRLTVSGYVTPGYTGTISNTTISLAANTSGASPWDSAASPTAITFGGSASIALTHTGQFVSDEITFIVDGSRAILLAYNMAAGAYASLKPAMTSSYSMYSKTGVSEAATTDRGASYTLTPNTSPFLAKLEVFS